MNTSAVDHLSGKDSRKTPVSRARALVSWADWPRVAALPMSIGTVSICLLVLTGYAIDVELLYRPIDGGPATNPLTALCLILLGLAHIGWFSGARTPLVKTLALIAVGVTIIRVLDHSFGDHLLSALTPFKGAVRAEVNAGASNAMGIGTAAFISLAGTALVTLSDRRIELTQSAVFLATMFPVASLIGYAYGVPVLYGDMSILTASLAMMLSLAMLGAICDVGPLGALLADHSGSKISRLQALFTFLIPLGLGFLLVRSVAGSAHGNMVGLYVIAVCWFFQVVITISAVVHDRTEQHRQTIHEELSRMAYTDALTGLPNRRSFMQMATQLRSVCKRNSQHIWVVMADIDHFKRINDTAGHDIGDHVLKHIGGAFRDAVRDSDLVGRLGGEEFALALPDTDHDGVVQVLAKLRSSIESLHIPGWTDQHGNVTMSFGCTEIVEKQSIKDALAQADAALYEAKRTGRNRAIFSDMLELSAASSQLAPSAG